MAYSDGRKVIGYYPNSARGNPEPGKMYSQAMVPIYEGDEVPPGHEKYLRPEYRNRPGINPVRSPAPPPAQPPMTLRNMVETWRKNPSQLPDRGTTPHDRFVGALGGQPQMQTPPWIGGWQNPPSRQPWRPQVPGETYQEYGQFGGGYGAVQPGGGVDSAWNRGRNRPGVWGPPGRQQPGGGYGGQQQMYGLLRMLMGGGNFGGGGQRGADMLHGPWPNIANSATDVEQRGGYVINRQPVTRFGA